MTVCFMNEVLQHVKLPFEEAGCRVDRNLQIAFVCLHVLEADKCCSMVF
jgi:hypothetical protein